ncbi:MAG: hypothetical protein RMJ56_01130 [Gemmataceae bacterium]|nr:hypothetical protein [Gemmata sp.]MDW8196184.1 hypothetical protein [Gemmataceae bacterium]
MFSLNLMPSSQDTLADDNPRYFVSEWHNRDLDPGWWLELGHVELETIHPTDNRSFSL